MARRSVAFQTTPQTTVDSLRRTARTLHRCAKAAKDKSGLGGPTHLETERFVGLGIAGDWLDWAQSLESMNYSNKRLSKSDRVYGLQELTRFTFMWTAANALFSRPAVIDMIGSTLGSNGSEPERFSVLFRSCGLSRADASAYEKTLHALLATEIAVDSFPWASTSSPITTLDVIYYKYTVAKQQNTGQGKKLFQAASTKIYNYLDLPTLIYATRNWNIHGVLITTSFRGPKRKFNLWIDTINLALARVLEGAATALQLAI